MNWKALPRMMTTMTTGTRNTIPPSTVVFITFTILFPLFSLLTGFAEKTGAAEWSEQSAQGGL
jgi:hypothetical protein